MTPGRYDIVIHRGVSFELFATWKQDGVPVNLTDWTAAAVLRPAGAAEVPITATITEPPTGGQIRVYHADEDTELLAWDEGRWHLELSDAGGDVKRLIEGLVKVRD